MCLSMHNGTVLILLQDARLKAADVEHPMLGCFGVAVEEVRADRHDDLSLGRSEWISIN